MVSYLWGKIFKNKWMIASLLIGNTLLVGIAAGVPMYSQAIMQRIFIKDMERAQAARKSHPAFIQLDYGFTSRDGLNAADAYFAARDTVVPGIVEAFGAPALLRREELNMQNQWFVPAPPREAEPKKRYITLSSYTGFEPNAVITQGRMFSGKMEDGVIECVASQRTLDESDLLLNETLECGRITPGGRPLKIKIVGVYAGAPGSGAYWGTMPEFSTNVVVLPEPIMRELFVDGYENEYWVQASWRVPLDFYRMKAKDASKYLDAYDTYSGKYLYTRGAYTFKADFTGIIKNYVSESDKLNATLWVLQAPVFIMLAFFIFMVSKQILELERGDMAVIKSRGASRLQIIGVYACQGMMVGAASLALGVPLGMAICKVLGASGGFLSFVRRAALDVRLNAECFVFAGAAALLSVLTMLLPVVQLSKAGIVDQKRGKTQGGAASRVWRLVLPAFCALGLSLYSYYTFNNQKGLMAMAAADVKSVDPVLFLSSSLFIIGLGLLALCIFPYIVRLVFVAGRAFWPPAVYASFLKVMRSSGGERFIMIFLIFTLAVGVFDAKAARTLNLNGENQIQYQSGADLTFKEIWANNMPAAAPGGMGGDGQPKEIVYVEPDFERFKAFPEAVSVTKVLRDAVTVDLSGGRLEKVQAMGINSKEFGETAWFRRGLLPTHINNYLNVMAKAPRAAILSSNFKETHGYKIGDTINFRGAQDGYVSCVVYGFVGYWPGYARYERVRGSDGSVRETERFLVVASLSYLQSIWNVTPYEIWMKTNSASNGFIYTYAEANNISFSQFTDAKAKIVESRGAPVLQGANGVLTVGFIIVLTVCFTGFLIYWTLSIRSRVLQFGVFRAMGMPLGGIACMLLNEQFFISLLSAGVGVAIGEAASRLFMPLIEIGYSASDRFLPLVVVTHASDYARLFTVIGAMVLACLAILGVQASRVRVSQALKLGED